MTKIDGRRIFSKKKDTGLTSCKLSEKTDEPIPRKTLDGWTDTLIVRSMATSFEFSHEECRTRVCIVFW